MLCNSTSKLDKKSNKFNSVLLIFRFEVVNAGGGLKGGGRKH